MKNNKKLSRKEIERRKNQSAVTGFLTGDGRIFSMTKVKGGYKLSS